MSRFNRVPWAFAGGFHDGPGYWERTHAVMQSHLTGALNDERLRVKTLALELGKVQAEYRRLARQIETGQPQPVGRAIDVATALKLAGFDPTKLYKPPHLYEEYSNDVWR
jgi:hypothetical protein